MFQHLTRSQEQDFFLPFPLPSSLLKRSTWSWPEGSDDNSHLADGDGILLIADNGHISYANAAAERMFLATANGLQGKKFGLPLHEGTSEIDVHSERHQRCKAIMQCHALPRKRKVEYLVTLRLLTPGASSANAESGMRGELMIKLFNHSPIGIIVTNLSGQVTVWNNASTRILGWNAQDVIGHALPDTAEGMNESMLDLWHRTVSGEMLTAYELPGQKRDDGRLVDLQVWTVLVHNGKGMPSGILMMFADLTLHRRVKAHLRHAVEHDVLTGLPNRKQFRNQLSRTLDKVNRAKGDHLIIILIGIDRFKTINKSLGHAEGDLLLQLISQRLSTVLYETDLVARTGGDEFSILLRDTTHPRDGSRVSEKLLQCIGNAYEVNGREVFLTASIGIAVYPHDGGSADALIHAADSAMDRSKDQGGNCCQYFAEELDERMRGQLLLEQALHHAIEQDQFYLEYQPQWCLGSGRLVGVEALLRWRHPELGIIPPATFIPLAESNGLIVAIGARVLKKACRQLRHWDEQLGGTLRMAVNVSPRQFQSATLEADVRQAIEEAGIEPDRLELEITESMMARNFPDVVASLHALKQLGVSISIDDFGTGYSSLSYLADFPVDTLKIDQSFVRGVDQQPGCRAIISSVLTLVRGLNLRVIAEGIETESQLSFLRELGCDEGQGYLMGRPMSADALFLMAAETGGHG